MENSGNTGVGIVWNLVVNSPYLLIPNPLYNGVNLSNPNQTNPPNNFMGMSGFNDNIPNPNQAPNPSQANPPNNFMDGSGFGQPSNLNEASNLNNPGGNGTIFNTIWEMLRSSPTVVAEDTFLSQNLLMENVENPLNLPMAEVVENVGVGEAENVVNPLIPPMVEVIGNVEVEETENVEVEETENVGNPLIPPMVDVVGNVEVEEDENVGNPPMVEVVGNVGVGENENVGNPLGIPLPENPLMVEEAQNMENPPMALINFNPQDVRLITNFLIRRLRNEPLEENIIHEINFYDHSPQYMADNYVHGVPGVLFFFTPVRRLCRQKAVRKVYGEGGGSWCRISGYVNHVKDKDNDNRVVGTIKSFKFAPKNPNPNAITWLMKEYNLPNEEPQQESENIHECVLVKLYSN
ncbi:unnamed protein product [Fraxinus pennsylvanica]|uniref:NAC domain-containing protein n=1 Tax=Fraxinus pennsylvanica TaxID=56036 RepID=A0AAD1Z9J2_9LAMI|nr:unnamed protein product [Fraxinus pennsylvanica]